MTERQKYKVIQRYEDFELREYEPCVIAELKVSDLGSSESSGAFSVLFNYISMGNDKSQKIAMTSPVINSQQKGKSAPQASHVSFVMPARSAIENLPRPMDSRVTLREIQSEICVAKSFRGRATKILSQKIEGVLRTSAGRADIPLTAETRICRFDPPYKPSIFQYNEIVIPVRLGGQ